MTNKYHASEMTDAEFEAELAKELKASRAALKRKFAPDYYGAIDAQREQERKEREEWERNWRKQHGA